MYVKCMLERGVCFIFISWLLSKWFISRKKLNDKAGGGRSHPSINEAPNCPN